MPLLTGIHGDEEARAPVVRERPRVTRASRTRDRGASWARQRTDWPELPTTLTCWRHTGDVYQVLIEPAVAGHELVGVRGSTQASIEYIGGALKLITSLMGMVQRREALLSHYGVQIPPILMTLVTAAAPAPTVPPPTVGRKERQTPARSRGRARGIRAKSGPSEPILSDDDAEMSDFEEGVS
ncbi:uncharacterized protein LOC114316515 [Camellia sinensis]|uniref:uncharacterized protein LOC114316515 n=1 Tax=Camellia sinensis TaxID=4442 RepID=UPI001035B096|nr:uncharacterized protein LOC114316515 [Camellia sinensis]